MNISMSYFEDMWVYLLMVFILSQDANQSRSRGQHKGITTLKMFFCETLTQGRTDGRTSGPFYEITSEEWRKIAEPNVYKYSNKHCKTENNS